MYDKFFKKENIEYPNWEFDYPFAEYFLKPIFKDNFKRKYSKEGAGIFNLIFLNDKVYEIKFSVVKNMIISDGKKAVRDTGKDIIVKKITSALNEINVLYGVNSGKFITFKIQDNYIAKLEIIKKLSIPA